MLPSLGVHRAIDAAKRVELARVRDAIHREREANLAGNAQDPRLSNLVVYERRIADVTTWPFDLSTWVRFATYIAIGVGSWVGAALVERFLGAVLS